MNGKAGNNQIWVGTGNDSLRDNSGDDFVYAGAGNDTVYGGIGNDACYGDAGTDTVKGEVGDDIIKGGTGISFVNGGDGDDTLYCDPTTSSIAAVQTYLSESILDGGGTDTLNIFSYATYTASGATKATTEIVMSRFTSGHIFFTDPLNFAQSYVGDLQEVDKLTVAGGAAKLEFTGS